MVNRRSRAIAIVAAAAVVGLLATWIIVGPTQAALGNRGVPVYGRLSGAVPQSETHTVRLYALDGSFSNLDQVPTGKYLLVTDIVWTPDGGDSAANALVSLDVVVPGTSQALRLRSTDNASRSMHFTTPVFVLEGGDGIEVTNAWFSDSWSYVNISGLLVDNLAFLPLIIGN